VDHLAQGQARLGRGPVGQEQLDHRAVAGNRLDGEAAVGSFVALVEGAQDLLAVAREHVELSAFGQAQPIELQAQAVGATRRQTQAPHQPAAHDVPLTAVGQTEGRVQDHAVAQGSADPRGVRGELGRVVHAADPGAGGRAAPGLLGVRGERGGREEAEDQGGLQGTHRAGGERSGSKGLVKTNRPGGDGGAAGGRSERKAGCSAARGPGSPPHGPGAARWQTSQDERGRPGVPPGPAVTVRSAPRRAADRPRALGSIPSAYVDLADVLVLLAVAEHRVGLGAHHGEGLVVLGAVAGRERQIRGHVVDPDRLVALVVVAVAPQAVALEGLAHDLGGVVLLEEATAEGQLVDHHAGSLHRRLVGGVPEGRGGIQVAVVFAHRAGGHVGGHDLVHGGHLLLGAGVLLGRGGGEGAGGEAEAGEAGGESQVTETHGEWPRVRQLGLESGLGGAGRCDRTIAVGSAGVSSKASGALPTELGGAARERIAPRLS
jgi:hypothetical protein